MTIDRDHLYELLPALYRLRDEQRDGALRQFLEVLTDELAVVAEGIDQLHDDLFVETAAPWVLPYLAELIGLRGLPADGALDPRAEVANTIAYRRRKGTAALLEQVARDVTGWPSRAVEYFELIAATQQVNHVRPGNLATAPIRDALRMEQVGSPFERLSGRPDLTHTVDVRRITSRRGRHNIGNIGVFSWRLRAYPLSASPAVPADPADRTRFQVHPLGIAAQLFVLPVTEDQITHPAEPINVPHPLGRREFAADIAAFFGPGLSINLPGVEAAFVDVCDLSDTVDGGGAAVWNHTPRAPGRLAIDPVLGRIAFGDAQPRDPEVSFHYGFAGDLGGGEYPRPTGPGQAPAVVVSGQDATAIATLDEALAALVGDGVVEIADSAAYGPVSDPAVAGRSIEIRARDGCRPFVRLAGDLVFDGDGEGEVTLSGLLISGGALRTRNLRSLRLEHCTLVPGISLDPDGAKNQPGAPSLIIESPSTEVTIERCILGGIRAHEDAGVQVADSILDADVEGIAYAADTGATAGGGALTLEACTVLGKIHAKVLQLVSNSILLAATTTADDPADWPGPVLADRRQEGCVRFSYLPPGCRTPRRHHCQPEDDADSARVRPVLTSARYPDPGYCQLDGRTPAEVSRGADDESEMGAFHHLFNPQRAGYLAARLDDYLRFGLEAGFFFTN